MTDLLDELDEAEHCRCGKTHEECAEDGGCKWSAGTWRDGVLHAIARLDRLADAHHGTTWAGAYEAAAAALREELKITGENAA